MSHLKNIMLKKTYIFIICFLIFTGCNTKKEFFIKGKTMGTTFHITVVDLNKKRISSLKKKICLRLEDINMSMSTYIKESEISRFNRLQSTGEKFYISKDFLNVMLVADELYNITHGAWDAAMGDLINLWGFGNQGVKNKIPPKEDINRLLKCKDFKNIIISKKGYLQKKKACISIDLASIAKGYAVDELAKLIISNKINDFLVEIGGEIYASGCTKNGTPWKAGINMPEKFSGINEIYKIVEINNKALATSGNYRIFFEDKGESFSHIIDPETGMPVLNSIASVSIMAEKCIFADGLATSIMVMGSERGVKLVNRLEGVECLIIENNNGTLTNCFSNGFKVEKQVKK